jgi:hypothetical protein
VLRAAGETETTQGNNQDWLELDEGNPGFQLLTGEEITAVILYLFSSSFMYIINFSIYSLSSFILDFASLIRMTLPPQFIRIAEGLLYAFCK